MMGFNAKQTDLYIKNLEELIRVNKVHSIDPFIVYENLKKTAIEAYIKTSFESKEALKQAYEEGYDAAFNHEESNFEKYYIENF